MRIETKTILEINQFVNVPVIEFNTALSEFETCVAEHDVLPRQIHWYLSWQDVVEEGYVL